MQAANTRSLVIVITADQGCCRLFIKKRKEKRKEKKKGILRVLTQMADILHSILLLELLQLWFRYQGLRAVHLSFPITSLGSLGES